jgi:predicted kinase
MSEARHAVVVQMHGEPGSGKSMLARALAPRINAIVLDKDVIKSAILRAGASEALAASGAYETYFDLATSFIEQRHSIILDNPVFWPRVEERWLEASAAAGCPPILIECVCPDRDTLIQRLRSRNGRESQPREPLDLLRHPGASETRFVPRITLDTMRPIDQLVPDALDFIASRVAAEVIGAAR